MKTMRVSDFLTDAEIEKAVDLYQRLYRADLTHRFAQEAAETIIAPVMDRINRTVGQENDAKYLAYALEYAIMQSREKP